LTARIPAIFVSLVGNSRRSFQTKTFSQKGKNMFTFSNPYSSRKTILVVLLFLFFAADSFAQYSKSRPGNLNSWKPTHLLPRISDTPGPDSVVRTDFSITLSDGTVIDALKYVPVRNPQPAGGYPTVIMVHGYGDNKETLAQFCHDQATYGYYTMTFSMRGQGNSTGLSNLISRTEANDFIQIVQWVKNDAVNGSQPNNILVMGGSQGGLVPMQAAGLGLNVKTLISSVAPPDFATSWIENGSIKMTLLWTIEYPSDTARYSAQVERMSDWIYANNKNYWDSLAYWLPRDRDFVTLLPQVTLPVLIEASWQDKFFNADGWVSNLHNLTGSPMVTSYIGAVIGHGGEQSETENTWHMEWFNNWFYETLFDMRTPISYSAPYQYATTQYPVTSLGWTFVHDSSRTRMDQLGTPLKLYFRQNKKLGTSRGNGSKVSPKNSVSSGYTLQQAVYDEFAGSNFNSKFKVDSAVWFESDPLTTDLEWTGTPRIKLDYKSGVNGFAQFNFQIYEVQQNGTKRFVNRVNFTDRSASRTRKQVTFKGSAHSHLFKAGNRIRIKITNLDRVKEDTAFFGPSNPFVLPVMQNATHEVYLTSNCYFEMPVVVPGGPVSSYFAEGEPTNGVNSPYEFSLSQNYPNPFNPLTTINFSIGAPGLVQLKVYDILGREVATLVNEFRQAGSYSVTLNAINLASGAYFYRIASGDFSDVKRMLLVK
jgi:predicted acyl esterase